MPLLSWLLLSYSDISVWNRFTEGIERYGLTAHGLGNPSILMDMKVSRLEENHDLLQSLIQLLDQQLIFELDGGPLLESEPDNRHHRLMRKATLSNFAVVKERHMRCTLSSFRKLVQDHLDMIHQCIDIRNEAAHEKLREVLKQSDESIDNNAERDTPVVLPRTDIDYNIEQLITAFNKTGEQIEALIQQRVSERRFSPQTIQARPTTQAESTMPSTTEAPSPLPRRPTATIEEEKSEVEGKTDYTEADEYRSCQEFKIRCRAQADLARIDVLRHSYVEPTTSVHKGDLVATPSSCGCSGYVIKKSRGRAWLVPIPDDAPCVEGNASAKESSFVDQREANEEDNEKSVSVEEAPFDGSSVANSEESRVQCKREAQAEESSFADNEESNSEPQTDILIFTEEGEISGDTQRSTSTQIPRSTNGSLIQDRGSPSSITYDELKDDYEAEFEREEEIDSEYPRERSPNSHHTINTEAEPKNWCRECGL
jgi:hypothetical protein